MDIIISKYKKNIKWSEQFKDKHRVFIYDKSDEDNSHIKLPNIGREPHTFLHHIIKHYDDLSDFSCFLQDNPFDHMSDRNVNKNKILKDFSFIDDFDKNLDFYPIGNHTVTWDLNGPDFPWLEIKKLFFDKYLIKSPNNVQFVSGCQFIVKKEAIRLRTKDFYIKLIKEFDRTDIPPINLEYGINKFPWIMETIWGYIFDGNFKSKKNALITGSGGMLGKAAYEILSKKYNVTATDIDINEKWLNYLDVREISDFEKYFNKDKFDIIFHLAALTDLEYCENNSDNSWLTNSLGAENAALMAKKYDCEVVYISTAGIFDNPNQELFNDYDTPSPKSTYGKSKYAGEKIVQQIASKHYIFRAGWMMGGENKDKKFIGKILKQINSGKKELYVVGDKLGTPTYTHDFINNMLDVIDGKYYGLYNQVCKGDCSRFDVAVEMIKILKLNIEVHMVDSEHFKEEYYAPRPYSEKLVNLKLDGRKLNNMRHWKICLTEYLTKKIKI
jgi:dTDP-4-dehydrorhamnose reductase